MVSSSKSPSSVPTATPRSAPDRRQRRSAEIRERLFRAALNLFAQKGFLETTVEDITEAADVGKGTFFNYFPSKDHILLAFGEIRGDLPAAEIAHVFRQTIFGTLLIWSLYGDATLHSRIETAFNLLWTGLTPRGTSAPPASVPLCTCGD